MGHTLTVRLPKDLAEWLEERAAQTGVSQGRIVREQLERARAGGGTRRFMRLAGAIRGGPKDVSARKGFSRS
ncbi:MAG TPA: CopG family transcriptional regulator [Vicinamibacterales bacterium]|nr:CopG family transcriptional regulator [Vicinamibacterales bacterium]